MAPPLRVPLRGTEHSLGPERSRGASAGAYMSALALLQDRRIEELAGLLNQYRRVKEIMLATQGKRPIFSQRYSSYGVISRGSPTRRFFIFIWGQLPAGERNQLDRPELQQIGSCEDFQKFCQMTLSSELSGIVQITKKMQPSN